MCDNEDVVLKMILKDAVVLRLRVLALERIIEEMILFGNKQSETLGAISILTSGEKENDR